jgi:hypothetical protein
MELTERERDFPGEMTRGPIGGWASSEYRSTKKRSREKKKS